MFLKAVFALLSPSGLIALSCIFGSALMATDTLQKFGRCMVLIGSVAMLIVLICPVDQWLLRPLENRFRAPQPLAHVDGIILLGGAISPIVTTDRAVPVLNGDADRVTAFAALARAYPDAKLVFSGGSPFPLGGSMTEAMATKQLLTGIGVPEDRVVYEENSRTTWENAIETLALVQPQAGSVWILVTSASHMPRAMGAFRKAGWPMIVAGPVAYRSTRSGWPAPVQTIGQRLALIDLAAHEWVGLMEYRLRGRSDRWFPKP